MRRSSELTDVLVERIRRVRDNESEVTAAGYYLLTALEAMPGSGGGNRRNAAAKALVVSGAVLEKIGELTGRRDPDHGRKFGTGGQALSSADLSWIKTAKIMVARRVGEIEAVAGVLHPPRSMCRPAGAPAAHGPTTSWTAVGDRNSILLGSIPFSSR
jgi:hypothetical protein